MELYLAAAAAFLLPLLLQCWLLPLGRRRPRLPVSYTHLTLPTILLV